MQPENQFEIMRLLGDVVRSIPAPQDYFWTQNQPNDYSRFLNMSQIEYKALSKYFINQEIEKFFVRSLLNKLPTVRFNFVIKDGVPGTFEEFLKRCKCQGQRY